MILLNLLKTARLFSLYTCYFTLLSLFSLILLYILHKLYLLVYDHFFVVIDHMTRDNAKFKKGRGMNIVIIRHVLKRAVFKYNFTVSN